jgi:hypothetical protein
MKWDEITLIWIAGLWPILVALFLIFSSLPGDNVNHSYFVWLVLASLPVWLLCGLVWVTVHGRAEPTAKKHSPNKPATASLVIPLHDVRQVARHVTSGQGTSRGWHIADFLKTVCTQEEIERFANDTANAQHIGTVVSRLFKQLSSPDTSTEREARVLLGNFYDDMKLAEKAGFANAVKLVFETAIVRSYFDTVIHSILERATFFRGDVKMLRPLVVYRNLGDRFNRHIPHWEKELLQEVIGQKAIKRFLEHFSRMDRKAVHVRLDSAGYLPIYKVMKTRSVAELLDHCRYLSLSQRLGDACSSGLMITVLLGFFGVLLFGMTMEMAGLSMYSPYLFDTPWAPAELMRSLEKPLSRFLAAVDGLWNITAARMIIVVGIGVVAAGVIERLIGPWRKLFDWLYPHECRYCCQRFRSADGAANCCLSNAPTKTWTRQHKVTSRTDMWTYAAFFALLLIGVRLVFEMYVPTWQFLESMAYGGILVFWGCTYYVVWKDARKQANCMGCGLKADYYSGSSDVLCSRCYAQTQALRS